MSDDKTRRPTRRPRQIERAELQPGPARVLRDAIYDLYLRAGAPTLDELAQQITTDANLPGAPGRDVINRIISGRETAASQQDAVTVAVALASNAGRDPATVADHVTDLWVAAKMAPPTPPAPRLGRPIHQCDPIDLEVHRAIQIPGAGTPLPTLPTYVPRAHDEQLHEVVAEAAAGTSRIVVLVGGSSTGKTRACWEAIQSLPHLWRLWHPIDPSQPDAAAGALADVGPHTVVWLNEAQHYLHASDQALGERVAAGIRTLLRDTHRAPVLVLATMWREHWAALTTPQVTGQPDPHAQARQLLAGNDICVPDTFNPADLEALSGAAAGDPRLEHAARHASEGRVTQYLAGVPELQARYRNAPPAARAVIDVAIDARRLGHPQAIPYALLEHAAPGYLGDLEWDQAGDDWLEQALTYTESPCHGVPGPLTRMRPRPGDQSATGGQPHYRLADSIEQMGRWDRVCVFPPTGFWNAVVTVVTDPQILQRLGSEAEVRGRRRRAAQLYRKATDLGHLAALPPLAALYEGAGDSATAEALLQQALDDTEALRGLVRLRQSRADQADAEVIAQGAGADTPEHQPDDNESRIVVQIGPTQRASRPLQPSETAKVSALLPLIAEQQRARDWVGAEATCRALIGQGFFYALLWLGRLLVHAGEWAGAEAAYRQAADFGYDSALNELARLHQRSGNHVVAEQIRRFGLEDDGSPAVSLE